LNLAFDPSDRSQSNLDSPGEESFRFELIDHRPTQAGDLTDLGSLWEELSLDVHCAQQTQQWHYEFGGKSGNNFRLDMT
jgi:hypothetical protein